MSVRRCIFVGEIKYSPTQNRFHHLDYYHPKDFKEVFENILNDSMFTNCAWWTNNPLIVDLFSPENVFCCSEKTVKSLSEHPDFNKWKQEMSSGELWSLFGENW